MQNHQYYIKFQTGHEYWYTGTLRKAIISALYHQNSMGSDKIAKIMKRMSKSDRWALVPIPKDIVINS